MPNRTACARLCVEQLLLRALQRGCGNSPCALNKRSPTSSRTNRTSLTTPCQQSSETTFVVPFFKRGGPPLPLRAAVAMLAILAVASALLVSPRLHPIAVEHAKHAHGELKSAGGSEVLLRRSSLKHMDGHRSRSTTILAAEHANRAKGERGIALALSYTTISVLWYLCGMTLVLTAATSVGTMQQGAATRKVVLQKLAGAWAATFAASQVTTPWRAAGAITISPLIDRLLRRTRDRLGVRGVLLPAALCATSLIALFAAGVGGLAVLAHGRS